MRRHIRLGDNGQHREPAKAVDMGWETLEGWEQKMTEKQEPTIQNIPREKLADVFANELGVDGGVYIETHFITQLYAYALNRPDKLDGFIESYTLAYARETVDELTSVISQLSATREFLILLKKQVAI